MLRLRLSHFLAVSLALHAAAVLVVRNNRSSNSWSAGPLVVRLAPAPENTRESRPKRVETAVPAMNTRQVAARQAATAAQKIPPQRRPANVPVVPPAMLEKQPDSAARPGPAQAVAAATDSAELERQLLDSLHAALAPHFSYPLLARRRGWEGIVRVGLRVEANGRLSHLHLVEPSPYSVLNTAAINSLARLARLPNAGTWLQGRQVDLVIPVEYRLLEG